MGVMNSLEELKSIYADASEWLKFLEAKHAGLFAVWTAALIAMFSTEQFYDISIFLQGVMVAVVCGGLLIDLIALAPFLNQRERIKNKLQKATYEKYKMYDENAVFYITVFSKTYNTNTDYRAESVRRYKDILLQRGFQDLDTQLYIDYMMQIIDVSTVGSIKAYLFNLATKYSVIVMVVGIVGMVIA